MARPVSAARHVTMLRGAATSGPASRIRNTQVGNGPGPTPGINLTKLDGLVETMTSVRYVVNRLCTVLVSSLKPGVGVTRSLATSYCLGRPSQIHGQIVKVTLLDN